MVSHKNIYESFSISFLCVFNLLIILIYRLSTSS